MQADRVAPRDLLVVHAESGHARNESVGEDGGHEVGRCSRYRVATARRLRQDAAGDKAVEVVARGSDLGEARGASKVLNALKRCHVQEHSAALTRLRGTLWTTPRSAAHPSGWRSSPREVDPSLREDELLPWPHAACAASL